MLEFKESMHRLAKLGEHPEGGFGMQKSHEFVACAREWHLVDQTGTLLFGVCELAGDPVGGEREVMDARAVFCKKFGNRTFLGHRFKQFDVNVSGGEKCGADLLGFHFLTPFTRQSEDIFIIGDGLVKRVDGDSEVVDFGDHDGRWTGAAWRWEASLQVLPD
jgi:hypothetical protein